MAVECAPPGSRVPQVGQRRGSGDKNMARWANQAAVGNGHGRVAVAKVSAINSRSVQTLEWNAADSAWS